MWLSLLAGLALATEVVWLTPRDPAAEVRVATAAGATGPPLGLAELRHADTAWSAEDEAALDTLDAVLADVRSFESRLDGELVIMRELAAPIAAVGALRDEADRERLFRALVYQGFAVERFYAGELAASEQAAAYRLDTEQGAFVRPWIDALALEPERSLTPYDVAEAPARLAYQQAKEARADALPALIVPLALPEDGALLVDGRRVEAAEGRALRVPPGRHLVHLERAGLIAARWQLELGPAERAELAWPGDDASYVAWTAALAAGEAAPPPDALGPSIAALGGAVVVAVQVEADVRAYTVTPERTDPLALPSLEPESQSEPRRAVHLELVLGGGWLGSHDFYTQDPLAAEPTAATVNAVLGGASLALSVDLGQLRLVGGADVLLPLGEGHAARTRDRLLRPRPIPLVGAGIRPVQLVAGYAFPYHPWAGARVALPLAGPLELRGMGGMGFGAERRRTDGSTYTTSPLGTAWVGLGSRL